MKVKGFVVSPNDEREKIKENLLKMLSAQGIEVIDEKEKDWKWYQSNPFGEKFQLSKTFLLSYVQ